jgi:hypothetical protein
MPSMDPKVHARFLDYRERYIYFAKGVKAPQLSADEFVAADGEHRALAAKGEARDDEEDARFQELAKLLFRD